ncbi:MAG TPA: response regulator [Thermoanaerobaculia bacterium]|jgi:CheY-like chemotaxis protein
MTAETRRKIFRYGIAIDLVILATGFGLLEPAALSLLFIAFLGAVMLSAWKGGWGSGLTAVVLSVVALAALFGKTFSANSLVAFAGASLASCFIVRSMMTMRGPRLQYAVAPPANVVAFDRSNVDPEELEIAAHERHAIARGLERTAAQQLEEQREAIRRETARQQKEAEERARREAEEAQREAEAVLAQRLAAEREAIEREAREHHERAQRELEEARLAAAREAEEHARREAEAVRLAAEAELAQRLAEEREAIEREARERARQEAEAEVAARFAAEREALEREARERAEREAEAARRAEEAEAARLAAEERARAAEEVRRQAEAELEQRLVAEREAREQAQRDAEITQRTAKRKARSAKAVREQAEAELAQRLAEERAVLEREAQERAEREAEASRRAAEAEEALRLAEERARAAEELRRQAEAELAQRLEAEREALQRDARERAEREAEIARNNHEAELARRLAEEREVIEREAREYHERTRRELEEARLAAGREAEERARHDAEEARRANEEALTQRLAEERERIEREARERYERELESARAQAENVLQERLTAERTRLQKLTPPAPKTSLVTTVKGWFRRDPAPRPLNLQTKKIPGNTTVAPKRPIAPAPQRRTTSSSNAKNTERKPRLLLLEKRRGTADTVIPRLRQKGVEVQVVERWVDAVDELFRFRPDAIFIDSELPEFEKVYHSITDQNRNLPVFLTARASHGFTAPSGVRFVGVVTRPYDADELIQHAHNAVKNPEQLLARQTMSLATERKVTPIPLAHADAPKPALKPVAVPTPAPKPAAAPPVEVPAFVAVATEDKYEVTCINCRVAFDALDSDWCSCLTKERTLVCTNCLSCFCKAAPAYKEKFWVSAPSRLFERKASEARLSQSSLPQNPSPDEVRRPLVLSVEDDEEIQVIVHRVCNNLGYGFVHALNGQDGLTIARLYRPNLILSDAFMPKLDGREMCRILREEPTGAECKMVVMTGLYTDTKYRSEAIKRFHVDDYLSKPVAITDLINLLQRHLEGVTDLPVQEDLHDLHRRATHEIPLPEYDDEGVPLADLLNEEPGSAAEEAPNDAPSPAPLRLVKPDEEPAVESYEVCCFNCQQTFDATRAEWCSCLGRDQTLACTHCGSCFCKAPSAYRERFWIDAPPSLFERKMIGSKRSLGARQNPAPHEVKRPLILLVEDDENIQLIVRTVVTTMGFGFIVGANGQEGLSLAREYNPDLILSDAFMPKLDGREMCRLLKEDPVTARAKAIIMTGLYTDRKYRNEALDYFKVDDYVAKPLAVDDLIKLFKKHLPQEVQATM